MLVRTQEEVAEFNQARGEIMGVRLFLSFPEILKSNAEEIINEYEARKNGS